MIRETYYAALFAKLQTLQNAPFRLISRKLVLLGNTNDSDLPSLYMTVGHQMVKPRPQAMPPTHTLMTTLYIYASNPDSNVSADPALNQLLDAVEACLTPTDGRPNQTLGGLVQHCWIEGTVEVYSGANSQIAAAIVPVAMLAP